MWFRVDWGNLQIHGYPLDIHGMGVDCDAAGILGQSWILDTLQGRLGQCGSGWTGAICKYPLDIHGIGSRL